jgi:hydroxymethylpyrimidine pyrophosphatase-like HAD family hydrolase
LYSYNIPHLSGKDDRFIDRTTQYTISCLGRSAPLADKKAFDPDGQKRLHMSSIMRRYIPHDLSIKVGGTTSIDIIGQDWDKAVGLEKFFNIHRVKYDRILFFGDRLHDGGNDYPVRRIIDTCIDVDSPINFIDIAKKHL